jgi:serine phosphatase RsbU (regulator of sigma subunit)
MPAETDTEQMECMEIWGGSEAISRRVRMRGMDAWVYSKPYKQANGGGDVYYASSCATGRINRVLLADVAGHGSAVAGIAVTLRGLMRRFVNCIDQAEFVRSMNRTFVTCSPDGCFATALVSTFFAPTRRLTVCNAGHPQPLWYRARDKQWQLLRHLPARDEPAVPRNMPLGILDLVDYEQSDVEMGVGDLMVFYTDALIEGCGTDGHMLCEAGLLRVIEELGKVEPEQLIDRLLAALSESHPSNLTTDDVTILVLRPTGQAVAAPLSAQLRGLGRMIYAILTRPRSAPLPDLRLANVGGAVLPWLGRLWRPKV